VKHASEFVCLNARFVVSKAGRERVLAEGRKNVHAVIRGDIRLGAFDGYAKLERVRYNPYVSASFVTDNGAKVTSHEVVMGGPDGVFLAALTQDSNSD